MSQQYEDMELRPGEAGPGEFFAARGWNVESFEEDGEYFADLVRGRFITRKRIPRYGRGRNAKRAELAAMRRWQSEQGT